jgi:hypothetical protein
MSVFTDLSNNKIGDSTGDKSVFLVCLSFLF